MKMKALFITLFLLLTLTACERKPDLESPKYYEEHGINFKYPGNWNISDDAKNGDVHYLIVNSTGDAVFMIHTFKTPKAPKLEAFAETLSSSIAKEMPFGEMKTESMKPANKTEEETWVKEKLSVNLLGQSLPHIREYRTVKALKRTAFLTSQTSEENEATVKSGFKLIIQSFSVSE